MLGDRSDRDHPGHRGCQSRTCRRTTFACGSGRDGTRRNVGRARILAHRQRPLRAKARLVLESDDCPGGSETLKSTVSHPLPSVCPRKSALLSTVRLMSLKPSPSQRPIPIPLSARARDCPGVSWNLDVSGHNRGRQGDDQGGLHEGWFPRSRLWVERPDGATFAPARALGPRPGSGSPRTYAGNRQRAVCSGALLTFTGRCDHARRRDHEKASIGPALPAGTDCGHAEGFWPGRTSPVCGLPPGLRLNSMSHDSTPTPILSHLKSSVSTSGILNYRPEIRRVISAMIHCRQGPSTAAWDSPNNRK